MNRVRQHPVISLLLGIALIVLIVGAGTGIYVASVAGDLPWQTDPTRIAVGITPFADTDLEIPAVVIPTKVPTTTP